MLAWTNSVGVAIGQGRATLEEMRSVEVLCHTALAAIKTGAVPFPTLPAEVL